jgi:hypothetical protein
MYGRDELQLVASNSTRLVYLSALDTDANRSARFERPCVNCKSLYWRTAK